MTSIPGIVIYICAFLLSFGIVFLYKQWSLKHSILDIPNERSSHETPTPRGGGIAIVLTFYAGLLFMYSNDQLEKKLFFALLPGLFLAIVGIIDDIKGLTPWIRFAVQFICSAIALSNLGGFHVILGNDFQWIWFFLALIGSVWFINLFNFLDGSDGYASMEAISVGIFLWLFTGFNTILLLVFAVGGFLYWNWPKARIFMGDIGSTVLGFILVVFGIYFHNTDTLNILYWILITSLFWFDATITLVFRILNKEKLSKAHKNHIYQRIILGGFTHLQTMLSGFCINVFLFFFCYLVYLKVISALTGFLIALILLLLLMKFVDYLYAYKKIK